MADGRRNNGGHSTKGFAGRPPKADEQRLIETLTPLEPIAQKALKDGLNDGQPWAVKLWFEYYYGKPKNSIELSGNTDTVIRFKDAE
jgi:hypothetical protein